MTISIPQLLADLVRLPSVNPMGREPNGPHFFEHRVTDYLERFFRGLGVPYERQPVAPQRENIVARFDPPGAKAAYLWEVHQDTVPADGMTIDPFGGEVRDGKLYGRGACDVKGGMAAMLAAFARLAREKPEGAASVVLACTVDEENTFLGVRRLARSGLEVVGAIVAEPTRLRIVDAHKGAVRWRVLTEGRACHSSRPEEGVNAIYRMGRVLAAAEEYAEGLRGARSDPRLGTPTLSVGRIEGGVSVNTVPDRCVIEIDRRLLPGESGADAHRDFREFLSGRVDFPVTCEEPWLFCPPLGSDGSEALKERLGAAIDAVCGPHAVEAVYYGTDASTLAEAGIPSVVFGPGDIAQAHTRDEWVELAEVERAAEVLYRFARGRVG